MSNDFSETIMIGVLAVTSPFWGPFWLLGWAVQIVYRAVEGWGWL